jgi:hypothetical protein
MRLRSTPLFFLAILAAAFTAWLPNPALVANQSPASIADDPVLGTWHLVAEKSRYIPGPVPKSQTRTYETHPDGLKATIKTTNRDGTSATTQYIAKYDMVEYPITGNPEADMITLKKVDKYTADAALMHAGKEYGSARRVISEDGKQMTITFQGRDSQGRPVKNVGVYEKE